MTEHTAEIDAATAAEVLRTLACDSHSRAVLAKAFREAPMANAAVALHALADDVERLGVRWRGEDES